MPNTMNTMLINLVSTNAGWLARQAIKYFAVLAAVLTGWLVGHGFDATHAGVIAAGVTSAALGLVEGSLSFIARKYAVPELEGVNAAIEAAKKNVPLAAMVGWYMCLTSCAGLTAFIASPIGQASMVTAEAMAKQLATATEEQVVADIITKSTAKIAALNAQGVNSDTAKEVVRQSEIIGLSSVVTAAQQQYIGMTGHPFVLPKNPVSSVTP